MKCTECGYPIEECECFEAAENEDDASDLISFKNDDMTLYKNHQELSWELS